MAQHSAAVANGDFVCLPLFAVLISLLFPTVGFVSRNVAVCHLARHHSKLIWLIVHVYRICQLEEIRKPIVRLELTLKWRADTPLRSVR